jgi:hypothetical protein
MQLMIAFAFFVDELAGALEFAFDPRRRMR